MKRKTKRRGLFLTLEGMDGCGKSTQARLLLPWLRRAADGRRVLFSREPGGTPLGRRIRRILLDPKSESLTPWAELLLYCADRAQHMEKIRRHLAAGGLVLCDRFMDSTTVYQGFARRGRPGAPPPSFIEALHWAVVGEERPHLTVVFDLPVEEALRRARGRNRRSAAATREGRFEAKALSFHRRIRAGFLELARREPKRVRVLRSSGSAQDTQRRLRRLVQAYLEKAR